MGRQNAVLARLHRVPPGGLVGGLSMRRIAVNGKDSHARSRSRRLTCAIGIFPPQGTKVECRRCRRTESRGKPNPREEQSMRRASAGTILLVAIRSGRQPVAATDHRHRLHGDDRQSAIWLDAVRPSDERGAWVVGRRHPDRVQPVCRARNLADADRGLDRRSDRAQKWASPDGRLWRAPIAVGWIINSRAATLATLYLGAALSGIGAGAIYATCVGNAVKWFPDRRGLAVGLTAAGFGAGAALTVVPIRAVIAGRWLRGGVFLVRAGAGRDRLRAGLADALRPIPARRPTSRRPR